MSLEIKIKERISEVKTLLDAKFESDAYYLKYNTILDELTRLSKSTQPVEMLKKEGFTPQEIELFWMYIQKLNWKKNYKQLLHNKVMLNQIVPKEIHKSLEKFIHNKANELYDKYEKDWLGEPGIEASDDSWSDIRYEIVGRGKKYYEEITVRKMQNMANNLTYNESFAYIFLDL